MRSFSRGLSAGFVKLPELVPALLGILRAFREWICGLWRFFHSKRCRDRTGCCIDIPSILYKRPDPMIYSQHYLMAQGLSVTWNNPDIQLYRDGAPVSSSSLEPSTEYEVEITVWNNSYDAPCVGLGVQLSFLAFGAGTTSHHVGSATVDLGVKGGAQHPAVIRIPWKTPRGKGHYCLQAQLVWADDANPDNNVGQENTNVGVTQSPANFEFTVGNQAAVERRFQMAADMFAPPPLDPCEPEDPTKEDDAVPPHKQANVPAPFSSRLGESRVRWDRALAQQGYGRFPVGPDFDVEIVPDRFSLAPGAEQKVQVSVEPKKPDFRGPQPFNVHAFAQSAQGPPTLVGGVTLYVRDS